MYKKHIREALAEAKALRPDLRITVERQRVHHVLKIALPDGRTRSLACSGTPKDPVIATRRTVKEILRLADEPKEKR